jgi:hypothetical protein
VLKSATTLLVALDTTSNKALDLEADVGSIGRFTHDKRDGKTKAKMDLKVQCSAMCI